MERVLRTLGAAGQVTRLPPPLAPLAKARRNGADPLPLLHRLAIAYLMVPVFVWLAGWFKWWFGLPAALFLGLALAPALRGPWRPVRPSPSVIAICLMALAWTMATAHGGLFDGNDGNNPDWVDRRSMLLDLVRHPWPVHVRDDVADYLPWGGGERSALLRYPLAWYMVPALAGRLFGPAALNWAVPLWSALGAALVLLLFVRRTVSCGASSPHRGLRGGRAVLAAGMFVLFSGMDALRILLDRGIEYFRCCELDPLGWPGIVLQFDERDGMAGVRTLFQPTFLSFKNSPQFIGAALYALLLLQLRRSGLFVAASGVILATALFWSPFVAIGLLPLAAVLVFENGSRRCRRALLGWSNLCLAAPLAGLIALHLTSGALDFGNHWLWERYGWQRLAEWAAPFYWSEFLLLILAVLALRPRLACNPFFMAMLATLLLLPWYRLANINLTLQGSFPALVLLAWFCVHTLFAGVPSARRTRRTSRRVFSRLMFGCLAAALAIGATGSLMYMAVATRDDVGFWFAASGSTAFGLTAWLQRENLAAEVQPPLAHVLRRTQIPQRTDAPRGPAFTADFNDFNVHVRDKNLVFANDRCGPNDRLIRVRFLPTTLDTNAHTKADAVPRWYGPGCGAMVGLPGWPVLGARVGQTPNDGGDWAVEILFDKAGQFAGLSHPPDCSFWGGGPTTRSDCGQNLGIAALRDAYRRVRARAPSARSHFDVYMDDEWLTLARQPCAFDDMKPRFFLHLVPADMGDLPPARKARKASGFDNRDFAFGERGALFDGKCVATWRLPYRVAHLRTGQYTAKGELWSASVRRSERRGN